MALSREQVGLVFKIEADSQPAQADIAAFQNSLSTSLRRVFSESETSFSRMSASASGNARIMRETFITASSEIIESWGVDGDIANEIGKMLFNLGPKAIVASVAVVGAFATMAAGVVVAVKAAEQMVEVAERVGTKSKEDFEKFAKSVREAGGQVTSLDRAMSQELTRSVGIVKAATDNLFIVLIRESGPELIGLLRTVTQLLIDAAPVAQKFGEILSASFIAAGASLKAFGPLLSAFKNAIGGSPQGVADFVRAITTFDKAIEDAVRSAAKLTPPAATFDTKKAKESHDYQLDLLKEQGRETELMIRREIELAETAFREKGLAAKDYEKFATDAEQRILIAKLLTFDAERKQVNATVKDKTERAVKLQKIENEELAARQNTESALAKIRKDARDEEKRIAELENKEKEEEFKLRRDRERREIDALRDFLQERNKMLDDLGRARVETLGARATDLETRAQTQPRLLEAARAAREQAKLAELEFQRTIFFARLNAAEEELKLLATTEQQKAEIEARYNEIRLEAIRQFQFKRQAIEDEFRRLEELQNPLSSRSIFGDAFADALANDASRLQAFKAMFADFAASLRNEMAQMPSLAETAFGAMTQGLAAMVEQFVLTGQTGPAALRQLAAAVLLNVAKMAAVKAVFALAEGFIQLALFNFPAAAAAFKAAALYGVVAGVAGIAGRAVAPSTGGEGGGFGDGGRGDNGRRTIEQGDRDRPQHIIIHLRAEVDEGVVVRRIVDDYNNNGPTRQTFGKG